MIRKLESPRSLSSLTWKTAVNIKTIQASSSRLKFFFNQFLIGFGCGGHLGWQVRSLDIILKGIILVTIPPKFGSNCASSSRREHLSMNFPLGFLCYTNISCGSHLGQQVGSSDTILKEIILVTNSLKFVSK